jgi:hypothetical protein
MALLSKPSNAPRALSNLMTLVDAICYHAGDRSIDVRNIQIPILRTRIIVTAMRNVLNSTHPGDVRARLDKRKYHFTRGDVFEF